MLFLSNYLYPHLLMRLELDGAARWCTYLSPGCCGGAPAQLPNGTLVVSSGCGGILTWLDPTGQSIHKTKPHEGVGLATAFLPRVRVLSDSSAIVDGGPGVLSYGADGSLQWRWKEDCVRFDYDAGLGLLVTASWGEAGRTKSVSISCVKNLGAEVAKA
jgi:hypothetical protein